MRFGLVWLTIGVLAAACGEAPTTATTPQLVDSPSPVASASPTPAAQPFVLSGSGSKVTAKVAITKGTYTIAWTAKPNGYFGVTGKNLDSGDGGTIINEIAPTTGSTLFDASGGTYVFQVEGSGLTWSLTFTPLK